VANRATVLYGMQKRGGHFIALKPGVDVAAQYVGSDYWITRFTDGLKETYGPHVYAAVGSSKRNEYFRDIAAGRLLFKAINHRYQLKYVRWYTGSRQYFGLCSQASMI
jgi:hypothetical protein